MKNPLLIPEIREMLKKRRTGLLKSLFAEMHEREAADYISLLRPVEIWKILNLFDLYKRSEVFAYMDIEVQTSLIEGGSRTDVLNLILPMSHDDRASLFNHLNKDIINKLMLYLPPRDRNDILHLTSYKDGTCGAIMTTNFIFLKEDEVIEKVIRKIRKVAPSKETIYYLYVTDSKGALIGFVSLRKLILSRPKLTVKDIMKTEIIYSYESDDQEKAASLISDYDLLALPVVDRQQRILGIITYDDAMDIMKEEQTEDLEKLMAISGGVSNKNYLNVSVLQHFSKRVFWVLILGVMGLLTGLIIQGFEDTLKSLIILTFYMPLLNAAGGNTGSQSATVVMRALTLNELKQGDILKVVRKEFVISLLLGCCLALLTYFRVMIFSNSSEISSGFTLQNIAFVISLALGIQIVWSTIFGAIIPLIATKLKIDPAVFSSPALTTFVDMGGIIIYFSCAKLILGI